MNWKRMAVYGTSLAIVTFGISQSNALDAYIQGLKNDASYHAFQRHEEDAARAEKTASTKHSAVADTDAMLTKVKEEAEKRRVAPIDARSDRVWGLIPGYNGLEVDIERTYKLAKEKGKLDEQSIVLREVAPKVDLNDLQPREIYHGNPEKPMVSLMINVAWGDEFLPDMLNTLKRANVHATFFFDGSWLSKHRDTAKLIQAEGHELSNHAYSHKNMSTLTRANATLEMQKTQDLLTGLGVNNTLFAPPSGDFNQETVKLAAQLNMRTILWTVDTIDWREPGKEAVLSRIRARIKPGSLVLMHPTASSRDALEAMISFIRGKGLTLGTVSELLSPNRVPESKATSPGAGPGSPSGS